MAPGGRRVAAVSPGAQHSASGLPRPAQLGYWPALGNAANRGPSPSARAGQRKVQRGCSPPMATLGRTLGAFPTPWPGSAWHEGSPRGRCRQHRARSHQGTAGAWAQPLYRSLTCQRAQTLAPQVPAGLRQQACASRPAPAHAGLPALGGAARRRPPGSTPPATARQPRMQAPPIPSAHRPPTAG